MPRESERGHRAAGRRRTVETGAAVSARPGIGTVPRGGTCAPPVSVVMAVGDEDPADVREALRSVRAQDYDGAIEIVAALACEAPGLRAAAARAGARVVRNPRGNAAGGLNAAIAAAARSHAVVVRCDARCILPPDYVRRAVATLARTGAANVGGMQRASGRTPFERAVAAAMGSWLGAGGSRYRVGGAAGPVDTVYLGVFRRDAVAAAGGFDEALERNQDYELNWRLRAAGETVWFDPELAVAYRPRGSVAALARQYFDYGRWKRAVLGRHPASARARQLAAPVLVLALAGALGAAAISGWAGEAGVAAAALAVPAGYAAVLALGAARAARREKSGPARVTLALATMHLAWGAGFLCGTRSGGGAKPPPAPAGAPRDAYKRGFDLAVLGVAAALLLPVWTVLGVAIAVAVRCADGGPVLHRQHRLGRGGQPFEIWKFRTMVEDAEEATGPVLASSRDARATALGRVLRRTHLDELPQVVNVLKGEMSLVGPRPERPELAARLEREVPGFARRLRVLPGLMGLAQARAGYHAGPRCKLRYDELYIRSMGPWLDIRLMGACFARAFTEAFGRPTAGRPGRWRRRNGGRRRETARAGAGAQ